MFRSPGQLRAPAGRELVLDYIIERKRMDDLCGSIIDGRFREQKVGVRCLFSFCNREEKWQIPRQSYSSAGWWREISWFIRRIANNFSICMSHLSHWHFCRVLLSLTLTELFFFSFDWRGVAFVGPSIWSRSVGRPPPTWVYLKLHCSRP